MPLTGMKLPGGGLYIFIRKEKKEKTTTKSDDPNKFSFRLQLIRCNLSSVYQKG